ncbi:protein-arginine deiminase type-3 [Colletotrichum liriopes]|uniref:Protein-arginine deiminase type-3 n=1 Tax=Colletotrichum liriopes TaxID=708192 RepID=A0AA37GAS0_9PEZI|nr:protein-arginine deiminase type-3 [Colletotrichum liriopes]
MHLSARAAAIGLTGLHLGSILGACQQPRPIIRADTNRDGIINEADDADKAFWTPARGAIFLPNVGDASNRCTNKDLRGNPLSNHELAACHDASGHLLLEPGLVAPLKTVPVDVADDAFAHIYATPDAASESVRLFVNDFPARAGETASWRLVDPEFIFNATQLKAGIALGIDGREFVKDASKWDGKVKDFLEPAYASMPGPDGPISIRIMLRSPQSTRTGGRQIFEQLRGKGVGGFQPTVGRRGFGHLEINSFGNLETIPPYTSKSGIKYPAGRIIQGKHFEKYPAKAMTAFLEGQELQKPLMLETGWLAIGHVDEFVQFLPSNKTGLGFTIAIADTKSALEVLKNASTTGHGGVRAISFNGSVDNAFTVNPEELATTIDQLLANTTFHEVNDYVQKHIDMNLETLLAEIPLAREHVVRVPVLFKSMNAFDGFGRSDDGLPSHLDAVMKDEWLVLSFSPAAINGIVLGQHYLSPKTWGPVVEGVDLFERAVREAYGRAGMDVGFVDDFLSHHVGGGEIHCGSNTFREANVKWWE